MNLTWSQRLKSKRLASKFCQNWRKAVLLVCGPTKTTQKEQLPLVPTHTNVLDGTVDNLCFAYINMLDCITVAWNILFSTGGKSECALE